MSSTIAIKPKASFLIVSTFLKQFFRKPLEVGSMLPSSHWLANKILQGLPLHAARFVVEYGSGSGAFTKFLISKVARDTQILAIEPNDSFARMLQQQFPGITIARNYADQAKKYLGDKSGHVDFVVSGLPFSLMEWDAIERTVRSTYDILSVGGEFRTFYYIHVGWYWRIRKLKNLLNSLFSTIQCDFEVRNFPPAVVIKCRK